MAEVGAAWQNGYAERLIRTIKEEEAELTEYRDFEDAFRHIGRFLEPCLLMLLHNLVSTFLFNGLAVLVDQNRVRSFLAEQGYAFVQFDNSYPRISIESADYIEKSPEIGQFNPQAAFDLIRRHYEVGLVSELDLREAQTQVEAARGDMARYTRRAAQAENALNLLAGAPVPRRDLTVPWARHYATRHAVQTGRGCAHGCRFCSVTAFHHQSYRHRPLEQVLDELDALLDGSGV